MRVHRGPEPREIRESTEIFEQKLRDAERRLSALTQELALKSEQLFLTKRHMAEVQTRRIEEERLKVVLQMAGATAAELDEPLAELLRVSGTLEASAGCNDEVCRKISELRLCADRVQQIMDRIQYAQASLLSPAPEGHAPARPEGVYRVLLLEQEAVFASSLCTMLAPWSEILRLEQATTCAEAERCLTSGHHDLILSDYQLPDGTSLDLITRLSTEMELPPFILISGQGSEDLVAQAVRRGACDYLPKRGLSQDRLIQSILAALERVRLKQELRVAHKHLAEMATHDELTGLYNRRYLLGALDTEWNRARRYHQPLTLCLFDLDHFKQLNDRFGHDAGDTVLVSVAETLHQTVRSPDVAGRYGGEEFLILLVNTDLAKAGHFAERLRKAIGRKRFHFMSEKDIRVTCSIGLAAYEADGERCAELIHRADMAMYCAKKEGRDRVRQFP